MQYAFSHPVQAEWLEDYRKIVAEIEGQMAADHQRFLRDHGIHRERIFLQRLPDGSGIVAIDWDCDDVHKALNLADDPSDHARYLREEILIRCAGMPATLFDGSTSIMPNDRVLAAEGLAGEALTSIAFTMPVRPDRVEDWLDMCAEMQNGSDRAEFQEFLRKAGIHSEQVFFQPAPAPNRSAIAIVVRACDDPMSSFVYTQESTDSAAIKMRTMIETMTGFDLAAIPMPDIELVGSSHLRRSDVRPHPNVALIRQGYEAFERMDVPALRRIIHPRCVWRSYTPGALGGSYFGIDEILTYFGHVAEETDTYRLQIEEVYADDHGGVAITRLEASRNGHELHTRTGVRYTIVDGELVEADAFNLTPPKELAEFWA